MEYLKKTEVECEDLDHFNKELKLYTHQKNPEWLFSFHLNLKLSDLRWSV